VVLVMFWFLEAVRGGKGYYFNAASAEKPPQSGL